MLEEVKFEDAEPRRLAIVRGQATLDNLSSFLMPALDKVWAFVRANNVPTGHNVILYHDQVFNLEAGVEVLTPITPEGEIEASSTPGGRVACVVHWGPYDQLTLAHTAIARACIGAGLRVAGPNWEVYGDWSDDPEKLRTDVYYLLRD